jgi:hypothetical protein
MAFQDTGDIYDMTGWFCMVHMGRLRWALDAILNDEAFHNTRGMSSGYGDDKSSQL